MGLAENLAKKFIKEFNNLHEQKGDAVTIGDIDILFKKIRGDNEEKLRQGIKEIAGQINKVKIEIANPHPDRLSGEILPDANLELDAVVKHTEEATNTILDSAEKIMTMAGEIEGEKSQKIIDEVTKIFEASNFQDITGQRINKVVTALMEIDTSVAALMVAIADKVELEAKPSTEKEKTEDEKLMSGPQLDSERPSQDDIDKLFAES